jgi:hypothetical protein
MGQRGRQPALRVRAVERDAVRRCACGGTLELVTDGEVNGKPAPFLACSGCEHCERTTVNRVTKPKSRKDA